MFFYFLYQCSSILASYIYMYIHGPWSLCGPWGTPLPKMHPEIWKRPWPYAYITFIAYVWNRQRTFHNGHLSQVSISPSIEEFLHGVWCGLCCWGGLKISVNPIPKYIKVGVKYWVFSALHTDSQWLGESRSLPWRGEKSGSYLHRTRLVSRARCFRRDFRPRSPLHRRIQDLSRLWRERDGIDRICRWAGAGARVDHVVFCGRTSGSFDPLEPRENVGGERASHAGYWEAGGVVRHCPTSCGGHDLEKAVKESVSAVHLRPVAHAKEMHTMHWLPRLQMWYLLLQRLCSQRWTLLGHQGRFGPITRDPDQYP